jgi:hypothetical protein
MDELKEIINYIVSSEMYLWNLGNEPLLIENVEYNSINSFIQTTVHELKMVLKNLRVYDSHSAELFKHELLSGLTVQFLIELISEI